MTSSLASRLFEINFSSLFFLTPIIPIQSETTITTKSVYDAQTAFKGTFNSYSYKFWCSSFCLAASIPVVNSFTNLPVVSVNTVINSLQIFPCTQHRTPTKKRICIIDPLPHPPSIFSTEPNIFRPRQHLHFLVSWSKLIRSKY